MKLMIFMMLRILANKNNTHLRVTVHFSTELFLNKRHGNLYICIKIFFFSFVKYSCDHFNISSSIPSTFLRE